MVTVTVQLSPGPMAGELKEALATSFKNAQELHFTDMYCRSDIGKDILG
jgi:phosphoribosylamine-glycine ligase